MTKNRWMSLVREIRLGELMKLVSDDEFVIIFDSSAVVDGMVREEDALFDGQALDWWKDEAVVTGMEKLRVIAVKAMEIETVAGPVIMIETER